MRDAQRLKQKPRMVQNIADSLTRLAREQCAEAAYSEVLIALRHVQKIRGTFLRSKLTAEELSLTTLAHNKLGAHADARATFRELLSLYESSRCPHAEQWFFGAARTVAANDPNLRSAWEALYADKMDQAEQRLRKLKALNNHAGDSASTDMRILTLAMACKRGTHTTGSDVGDSPTRYAKAIGEYRVAVDLNPDCAPALNELAWLLATCPIARLRSGSEAITHAHKACTLTEWRNHQYLVTLAAAHAEAGDFKMAVKRQNQAIDLLSKEKQEIKPLQDKQIRLLSHYEFLRTEYESQRPLNEGLVGWWTFEETQEDLALDASGNDLHGTLIGDAEIIRDKERGNVLRLDGDGDWVDCGNDGRFNILRELTLAAWIKLAKFDGRWQVIVVKSDLTWRLQRDKDRSTIEFACYGAEVLGSFYGDLHGKMAVDDGRWHHVVGVRSLSRVHIYVDGELDRTGYCTSTNIDVDDSSVWIGNNARHPNREWNGLIDDVRIYSYPLTEHEIKALYESTRGDVVQ
jgi:tetratricopeptide (TPR) repeat protein